MTTDYLIIYNLYSIHCFQPKIQSKSGGSDSFFFFFFLIKRNTLSIYLFLFSFCSNFLFSFKHHHLSTALFLWQPLSRLGKRRYLHVQFLILAATLHTCLLAFWLLTDITIDPVHRVQRIQITPFSFAVFSNGLFFSEKLYIFQQTTHQRSFPHNRLPQFL